MPVIVGQLGKFLTANPAFPHSQVVDAALWQASQRLPQCGYASSAGLQDDGSRIHFDSRSLREFGRRYTAAYLELVGTDDPS